MRSKSIQAGTFLYQQYGDADVLRKSTHPMPRPEPGEVTVEVISTGINHMEIFLRNGNEETWADDPWPRRSGSDFAGVVVARGDGVTQFAIGAEVIGHTRTGAHATHLNIAASSLVAKPKSVTWEVAGGLYLAGATALDTLEDLRIGPSDTVVVSAAAGGVGSIEVQLAKHWGAKVIGTCGDRNFDYLRQFGIIPVKYGEGIVERIQRVAKGPVTAFIDNFGKDGKDIAEALGVPDSRYRSSADRRHVELKLLQTDPESVAHGTAQLAKLAQLAQQRAFTLLISGLYSLDDITMAYADLTRMHSRGKVVLGTRLVAPSNTAKARDVHDTLA